MPREEQVAVCVTDLVLTGPDAQPVCLADLPGVQIVVLIRHRH